MTTFAEELTGQLENYLLAFRERAAHVLKLGYMDAVITEQATRYAATLITIGPNAEATAREIATYLLDRSEIRLPGFWATPLGRLICWHIGYPEAVVPASLIGPMMGTTRQYTYRVLSGASGGYKPSRTPDGKIGVRVEDMLTAVRQRHPDLSHLT